VPLAIIETSKLITAIRKNEIVFRLIDGTISEYNSGLTSDLQAIIKHPISKKHIQTNKTMGM
jgi:hypothetical protein|tara:strand:- start:53 stop:238 length:186 start_codon:yes stop_codon:yes gene_type:complete